MITGELKNKIDIIWGIFWTGGLSNPLDVIEQITYFMFIHDLDEMDNQKSEECAMLQVPFHSMFEGDFLAGNQKISAKQLKWSIFRDLPAQTMYEIVQLGVFPFIKNLHSDKNSAYSKYMEDAIFKIPTPQKLSQIIDVMDSLFEFMKNQTNAKDIKGDVYEYLLSKIGAAGTNGQFRTPGHIIDMMVELLAPAMDDFICDPACGTSGFLVGAGKYLKENYQKDSFFQKEKNKQYHNLMFTGYDMDRTMLRIGAMNMMTHGIDNPHILYKDSLSVQNEDAEKYSVILANPPFKGSLDYDMVSPDLLKVCKTKKTELLFLALFLRMLKTGGRCASIVPDGVLFGSSNAHKTIRKKIIENHRLEAIISMPSGVFKPYTGVSTAVILFTKTEQGQTDKVWFYDMQSDGFSLDDKRSAVNENDIPDMIARFHNLEEEEKRERTEKSFFVPKEEIIENGYELSIHKYKKVKYIAKEYPATKEIILELKEIEKKIFEGFSELEEML